MATPDPLDSLAPRQMGGSIVNGRYELRARLSEDLRGESWLAWDRSMEREVVAQMLPLGLRLDPVCLDQIKRLMRQATDFSHTNVMRVYDFHDEAEGLVLIREHVEGRTLQSEMLKHPQRCFEANELRAWMLQLCDAVGALHGRGLLHRDLRPATMRLGAKGELKLECFGLSAALRDWQVMRAAGGMEGASLAYSSPQALDGEDPRASDDVYAIGATLYELLSGRPAFYTGDVVGQIRSRMPPSIAKRREALGVSGEPVPDSWERAVQACLDKDAESRVGAFHELPQLLAGYESEGVEPEVFVAPTPKPACAAGPLPNVEEGGVAPQGESFTKVGAALFFAFMLGVCGWALGAFGLVESWERPTPKTRLITQGVEQPFSQVVEATSVNGFYQLSGGSATLVSGEERVPLKIRDRSFYKWGDVISIQTNRWTGKEVTGTFPVTYRVAVEVPEATGLRGKEATLELDLDLKIPTLVEVEGRFEFREEELNVTKSYPVKVQAKDARPLTKRVAQASTLLMVTSIVLGFLRGAFGTHFERGSRGRAVFNGTSLAVGILVAGGLFVLEDRIYLDGLEQTRIVAGAEEALARDDLPEARRLAEAVLAKSPNNDAAHGVLARMAAFPATLRVPDQFPTIAAAMEAAKEGDRIELAAGVHRGPVRFSKSVTIAGTGESWGSVIELNAAAGSEASVRQAAGQIGILKNVVVRHEGQAPAGKEESLVFANQAGVSIELIDVKLMGSRGHGLLVVNGGSAILRDCEVSGSAWSGAVVEGVSPNGRQSVLEVDAEYNSLFTSNGDCGIKARGGALLRIKWAEIADNGLDGVRIESASRAEIAELVSSGNTGWGLLVKGAGSLAKLGESELLNNVAGARNAVDGGRIE